MKTTTLSSPRQAERLPHRPARTAVLTQTAAPAQRGPTVTAFNPTLPQDGALIIAGVLRDQMNALNDDIQTRTPQVVFEAAIAGRPSFDEMNAALNTAILGTAQNPTNLSPIPFTISDPPTQSEMQQMVDWMNNLLSTLQRWP